MIQVINPDVRLLQVQAGGHREAGKRGDDMTSRQGSRYRDGGVGGRPTVGGFRLKS